MARKRQQHSAAQAEWLEHFARTGRSAVEGAREAAARGWKGLSPATIGRRLVEIRGSQRSGKHGWTPPAARRPVAPAVAVAPVVAQPAADAARLVELLSEAEANDSPDVDAERERILDALCDVDTWEDAAALELELACTDPVIAERLEAGETRPYALTAAGEHPLILSRAEDLRDLALAVREDDREAAAELLAEAHELVITEKS